MDGGLSKTSTLERAWSREETERQRLRVHGGVGDLNVSHSCRSGSGPPPARGHTSGLLVVLLTQERRSDDPKLTTHHRLGSALQRLG